MIITATIVADEFDDWFPLMIESINWTDYQVFVIDRSEPRVWEAIEKAKNPLVIHQPYLHDGRNADGKQRNAYLRALKDNFLGHWCLVVDTDEVLGDEHNLLKETMLMASEDCFDVKIRHFFYNLAFEDATLPEHYCPRRLFKITNDLWYPEVEHPVLQGVQVVGKFNKVEFFHYGPTKGVWTELRKYKKQLLKSNMHTPEQLEEWRQLHVEGKMPLVQFPVDKHPSSVKKTFGVKWQK